MGMRLAEGGQWSGNGTRRERTAGIVKVISNCPPR